MERMNFAKRIRTYTDPNACWLWPGFKNPWGYGVVTYRGRQGCLVHRPAYMELVGPIPDGMQLDHLCRVRLCMNPAHLEVVTFAENVARSTWPAITGPLKTHCIHGHPFDEANTYRKLGGGRDCRECNRLASLKCKRAKAAAKRAARQAA